MGQSKDQQRHITAYHEAGHAVIGRVLGLPCGGATIIPNPDENEAGHSITADPWAVLEYWYQRGKYREVRSVFLGRVIAYMAGAETEQVIFGQCQGGDGDDRYQISLMVDSEVDIPGDDWGVYEARLRARTRGLIRRHQGAIETVAQALLERGTLEAGEINRLVS